MNYPPQQQHQHQHQYQPQFYNIDKNYITQQNNPPPKDQVIYYQIITQSQNSGSG